MNENLNLCEILKDVPAGTELWSPIYGKLAFDRIENGGYYPIVVSRLYVPNDEIGDEDAFTKEGFLYCDYEDAECVLFPSKDQRDWSKFVAQKQKVKVVLHPFDRVLMRDEEHESWDAELLTDILNGDYKYYGVAASWKMCIPYNAHTAHLIGTTDPCPIDYEIEFSKEYKE